MTDAPDPLRIEFGPEIEGLRIVRQSPPVGAASVSATYVGPAGWGFDPPGREGTARLVNQLVTSAAGPFDRVAFARRLDRLGATLSRQSAPESGEVTVWGPTEEWTRLLGILADVVLRPRFDPSDVARAHRQVRERQLRESAQPASRAEVELLHAIFPPGHPYRETGLGSPRSLARITRTELVRFHRAHYTSGGALLVVTAPAARPALESVVRRLFRRFAESRGPTLAVPRVPGPKGRARSIDLPGRSQVEVRLGGASIARRDPTYPAAFLANEVLGGRPMLSRLFQKVREEEGLAYHASSELEAMRYGGRWTVQAGTGPDRWRKVVRMLREEIDRLSNDPVSEELLRSTRESAIGQIPLALESTADAHELAVEVGYHGLPGDYWLTWPDRLRAVTAEDVRLAAERALNGRSAVTVIAGPIGGARDGSRSRGRAG